MIDGSRNFKPNTTQLALIEDGLNDNEYNVHIDTGQYGGGNQLSFYDNNLPFSYSSSPIDFFDLKNGNANEAISANFNPRREGIWRYVISGYSYDEDQNSSGASYAGSDNTFISYGFIEDNQSGFGYANFNIAIAGTIVHEIGHGLCLSDLQSYPYQSNSCVFPQIDHTSVNYDSVMNYSLQMFQVSLSDDASTADDHDDWSAIDSGGIADFSQWSPSELSMGLNIAQAQKIKREGILGKVKRNGLLKDLSSRENIEKILKHREQINKLPKHKSFV